VSVESNSVESETIYAETQESGSVVATDYFPASKLFEYQWPLGDEGAEHYMLQEHVKEYPGQFDNLPLLFKTSHPPPLNFIALSLGPSQ
jgi:hypothetical protein